MGYAQAIPEIIDVNGTLILCTHVRGVYRTSKGCYSIETHHRGRFTVEGGRHLGGTRRDWFLECEAWDKPIHCTSVCEAVRIVEGM